MKRMLFLAVISLQAGCAYNQNKPSDSANYGVKPLVVLDAKNGGWGGDIRLSIIKISENDTSNIYKAVSTDGSGNVGLQIYVSKKKVDSQGFGNAITFKSIGKESDNLLRKLSILYKQNISANAKFIQYASASFVNLKEFAKSVVVGSTPTDDPDTQEYKLFFETKNDEGELFLNIDSVDRWIELKEKDPDYRPVIIMAFSQ